MINYPVDIEKDGKYYAGNVFYSAEEAESWAVGTVGDADGYTIKIYQGETSDSDEFWNDTNDYGDPKLIKTIG